MFSNSSSFRFKTPLKIIGFSAWVLVGFTIAQFVARLLFQALAASHIINFKAINITALLLFVLALSYVLALFIVVGISRKTFLKKDAQTRSLKQELGTTAWPKIKYIGFSLAGYVVYFILTALLALAAKSLFPGFNADQVQQTGFKDLSGSFEYILAFLGLVIIPPIVEEMLFRGYLFTQIRRRVNFWWTAFVVSLVFGLAHQQLNIGLDVFALSLVLCYLREKTGTIWAGVLLHMIKNGVAFTVLFLHPDILKLLTGG